MENIKSYEAMAKITLSEDERDWISILGGALTESFNLLEKIDTTGVEPLVTVLDINNVLREDVANKCISREKILATAPGQHDGYFQVPKALN